MSFDCSSHLRKRINHLHPAPHEVALIAGRQHQFVRDGCGGDLHVGDAARDALGFAWV